jgi:ribosomal protein L37AE/L43A
VAEPRRLPCPACARLLARVERSGAGWRCRECGGRWGRDVVEALLVLKPTGQRLLDEGMAAWAAVLQRGD